MRVLICGGRDFGKTDRTEYDSAMLFLIKRFTEYLPDPENTSNHYGELTIIEGGAAGADTIARDFATIQWLMLETYKADWNKWGRSAGPIRNKQMLKEGKPDLVIAFPGGSGTQNMIDQAKAAGIPVEEIEYAQL